MSLKRFCIVILKDTMELTERGDQSILKGLEKLSRTSLCASLH